MERIFLIGIRADGLASVYLPKPMLQERFRTLFPPFSYDGQDDGFIGWWATVSVGVGEFNLTIDPNRLALVLSTKLTIRSTASINCDVPCVGRRGIGSATIDPTDIDFRIAIFFDPVDPNELVFRAAVDYISSVKLNARVLAFGPWLALIGGYAGLVGFAWDVVYAQMLGTDLARQLTKAVRSSVKSLDFVLEDFATIAKLRNQRYNYSTFSGDDSSILIGLAGL